MMAGTEAEKKVSGDSSVNKKTKSNANGHTSQPITKKPANSSRIFTPFRIIGQITNGIPYCVQQRGRETYVTTCVGRAFQTFDCKTLNIVFVSQDTGSRLGALASYKNFLFAATGNKVQLFTRGKMIDSLECYHKHARIIQLDCLGQYLLALTAENSVEIWNIETKSHVTCLAIDSDAKCIQMIHPATYLNKILLALDDGSLQLWNIRTSSMIHSFRPKEAKPDSNSNAISCIVQSPVVDIVAIGHIDGTIILHNLRLDTSLVRLTQKGKVTAISFRTDGKSLIAAANDSGDIVVWDLDEDRLLTTMKGAHESAISSLHWLPNSEILLSAGADNAIKEWIFDGPDGLARLLKQRTGHHDPPTLIEYYGSSGHQIVSASRDRSIRMQSIYRDSQSVEMSQNAVIASGANTNLTKKSRLLDSRPFDLKLQELRHKKALAFSSTREKDWSNMITIHTGEGFARVWSTQRKAITTMILRSTVRIKKKSKEMEEASGSTTCVGMTFCGNYALLGSATGRVDLYNVQSGLHRRTYDLPKSVDRPELSSVSADSLNRYIVGCTVSGMVCMWSFKEGRILNQMKLAFRIQHAKMLEDNPLLVIAGEEGNITFIDIETWRIVRDFGGRGAKVTDFDISHDGRWLVTASLDTLVRTYDIPTGYMIDAFRLPSIATSISLSPVGDFLATAHVDSLGIALWANTAQFGPVPTRNISEEDVLLLTLPSIKGSHQQVNGTSEEMPDLTGSDMALEDEVDQITDGMLTLSTAPKSKWDTLLNLEIIRARNRPIEPPKAPEQAPFFLQPVTTGKRQDKDASSQVKGKRTDGEVKGHPAESRILSSGGLAVESELWSLLMNNDKAGRYDEFFSTLQALSASALDLEMRSVPLTDGFVTLRTLLRAFTVRLDTGIDFEAVQAYIALLFKVHSDLLLENQAFLSDLQSLMRVQKEATARFQSLIYYNLSMINLARGAPN